MILRGSDWDVIFGRAGKNHMWLCYIFFYHSLGEKRKWKAIIFLVLATKAVSFLLSSFSFEERSNTEQLDSWYILNAASWVLNVRKISRSRWCDAGFLWEIFSPGPRPRCLLESPVEPAFRFPLPVLRHPHRGGLSPHCSEGRKQRSHHLRRRKRCHLWSQPPLASLLWPRWPGAASLLRRVCRPGHVRLSYFGTQTRDGVHPGNASCVWSAWFPVRHYTGIWR